jgi:dTDP-4-dehydrorhamnose 3,5-epimerase-like enzyme
MDSDLAIQWIIDPSLMRLSEKDRSGKRLKEIEHI